MTGPTAERLAGGRVAEASALALLLAAFFFHARYFEFIQDDAFITFRYIRNFIDGNGLVFNIGERVEGYTTFLWLMILAIPAKLGINLIPASRYLGVALGMGSVWQIVRLSKDIAPPGRGFGFSMIAAALTAASGAVAYWSISGMETALFTFLTILSVQWYIRDRRAGGPGVRTAAAFFLLSLTRPEGILLYGITMGYSFLDTWNSPPEERGRGVKRQALCLLAYLIPTGVYFLWRIWYYGYLFPNTFYAKAGVSSEYFKAGVDYFGIFARNYLLDGFLLIVPIAVLAVRKLNRDLLFLFTIIVVYTSYVIIVGGDVLPAFRFFIPMLPLIYIFVQEGTRDLYAWMRSHVPALRYAAIAIPAVVGYFTVSIPHDYLRDAWMGENALVGKMAQTGRWLKANSTPETVVAASTIGALSYYSEATLIDMLGLTDEMIAHHPEAIFGVRSSWRERSYNVTYLLGRKPDWVCFSTGIKPSAYAERALFTRDEFRRWYYPYLFHPSGDVGDVNVMYRRSGEPCGDSSLRRARAGDNDFINNYYEGVNLKRRDPERALAYFQLALSEAPPDFALLYQDIGDIYGSRGDPRATDFYERALLLDPRLIQGHVTLAGNAMMRRDFDAAERHLLAVVLLDPDWAPGWRLLGSIYDSLGNGERAIASYRKALRAALNDTSASRSLQQLVNRGY
jgi:tetratricopeptide (TPR) repeat protein